MKQTIIPRFCTEKKGKISGNTFWQIEDADRYIYTCFEKTMVEKMEINVPCDVEVVTTEKNGKTYKNIRQFYASGPGAEARVISQQRASEPVPFTEPKAGFQKQDVKPERVETPITDKLMNGLDKPSKDNEKTACVLVSYAKDMWLSDKSPNYDLSKYAELVVEAYKLTIEKL